MHPLLESVVVTFSLGFVILAILKLKDLRKALADRIREAAKLRADVDRLEAWCEEKDQQLADNRETYVEPVERLGSLLIAVRLKSTSARVEAMKDAFDAIERIAIRTATVRFDLKDDDVVLVSDLLPSEMDAEVKAFPKPIRFDAGKPQVLTSASDEALTRAEAQAFAKPASIQEAMARMNQPAPVPVTVATSGPSAWSMADSSVAMWEFLHGKPDATVEELKVWFPSDDNARFLLKSCERLASHDPDKPVTSARTMASMMVVHVSRSTPGYETMVDIVKEAEEHLASVGI